MKKKSETVSKSNINDFVYAKSEEDIEEEERRFYESLGDCCYRGLDSFKQAIELLESPFAQNKEKELAIVRKNIRHICDLIDHIWEEHDG